MASIKQKKAFDKTMENYGNVSKSMREVGYSKNTAKNPKVLTESDGWKELMREYLPNKLLAQKHLELLNKKEVKRTFNQEIGEWIEVETGQIETQAVSKGLQMAYDLKGYNAPQKTISLNLTEEMPSTELLALAHQLNAIRKNNSRDGITSNGVDADFVDRETQD